MIVHKVTIVIAFIMLFLVVQYIIKDGICRIYAQEGQDYERNIPRNGSLSLATGQKGWINNANDTLFISNVTNESVAGNRSLRVDIKPAATAEQAFNSSWSVISTDFIPANDITNYNVTLDVSAKDVNQLHSKVIYYDANKNETHSDFIFGGTDGTFKKEFNNSVLPSIGTKYLKLQMWVRQSLGKHSSYLLDNARIVGSGPSLANGNNNKDHVPPLTIERVFTGINDSTNMAFLGPNDILVLERESGKVDRIVNGQLQKDPLIDVNTHFQDGLIGIATSHAQNGSTYVFLYFDEAPLKYNSDVDNSEEAKMLNRTLGYDREGDRLYRYKLVGDKLADPHLLFSIPAPKPTKFINEMHHGGELIIGPDNALYLVIGNLDGNKYEGGKTKAQNYNDSREPDGRAGILRLTQDGKPVGNGILGNNYPLNLYYAYGIRNSYGMDFDPVTGNLWDTENGPNYGDEINLVEPGFNSGADIVYGMSNSDTGLSDLVNFNGKGKYSDPEFAWNVTVGPTAVKFFNSDKFGKSYRNDMFVADVNNGTIYHFDLNENRTELLLSGPLADKVADNPKELQGVIFARGFGGITDMQVGPDGYLYILSLKDFYHDKYEGSIYRIVSKD